MFDFKWQDRCEYFEWIDPPMCKRSTQIVHGLLRKINETESEKKRLQRRNKKLMVLFVISWLITFVVWCW